MADNTVYNHTLHETFVCEDPDVICYWIDKALSDDRGSHRKRYFENLKNVLPHTWDLNKHTLIGPNKFPWSTLQTKFYRSEQEK